jgi:hypothetical protein
MKTQPCEHTPRCPSVKSAAWAAAKVTHACPEQGWSLLCNGAIAFDDDGGLLPDGTAVSAPPAPLRLHGHLQPQPAYAP